MSIENNLASIAKSLESIAKALESRGVNPTPTVTPAQVPAPVATVPPFVQPIPTLTPAPACVTPALVSPFSDAKGLISYVMDVYKSMGPEKGANIQDVLSGLGYQNINDVKPESYGALYAGIEALK